MSEPTPTPPEQEPVFKKRTYTWRTVTLDVLSAFSIFFMLIVAPVWGGYVDAYDGEEKYHGKLLLTLILVNIIPAVCAILWLAYRYQSPKLNNPQYYRKCWFITTGLALLYALILNIIFPK